jgi:TonB-like protein
VWWLAAAALLLGAHDAGAARRGAIKIDPIGAWSCVVYGHPAFGDERVLLHFGADGTAQQARRQDDKIVPWSALSRWTAEDGELAFTDVRTGRRYLGDLRRSALGGSWRTQAFAGGWWCTTLQGESLPVVEKREAIEVMPPLIPAVTSTPQYPVEAIRDAKQGRVVTCFFVDASGQIVRPEIVELSDEVFRAPILRALARSRYQGWEDASVLLPGCRSYTFKLEAMNLPEVAP